MLLRRVEDVLTHYPCVDFTLLIDCSIIEHFLCLKVAKEDVVILGADNKNCILHFVQNVKKLLLLLQNVTAFQKETSFLAFKAIASDVTQKSNHKICLKCKQASITGCELFYTYVVVGIC